MNKEKCVFDIIKIEKMIAEDFNISRQNLNMKVYSLPNLHSKYLKFFYQISKDLINLESKKDMIYIKKRNYFLTDCDEIIKPTHVDFYINGDETYAKLKNKVAKKKLELKVVEEALKRCSTVSFFVKNIIDAENFLVGN